MRRIQTVLFATDFSACSDQALEYAAWCAERFDAELHVLHAVVVPESAALDLAAPLAEETALLERIDEATHTKLRDLLDVARASAPATRLERRRGLRPGAVILDYATEAHADLIVLGTHGRRGPRRWFLGSTAEEVLRSASCNVLVVRQRDGGRELHPIRRLLVPVDFSDVSAASIRSAASIGETLGGKLVLFHVIDIPTVPAEYGEPAVSDLARIEVRVRSELRKLSEGADLEDGAFAVATDVGSAAAAIVDHAATHDCDLIVMPARSGRPLGLLGSTTDRVVRRATCPVWTLPPAPGAEAGAT